MLIAVILSAFTIYAIIEIVQLPGWGLALEARRLTDKPEKYFSLDNPDSYVLEAISTQRLVFLNYGDTQIDELMQTYDANNIEFNNYYEINFLSVDPVIFGYLGLLLICWIIWGIISVIAVIIARLRRRHGSEGEVKVRDTAFYHFF